MDKPARFIVGPADEMETANKYVATAADFGLDDAVKPSEKKTRIKQVDKLSKLLKIILSLARVGGYDVLGRVKAKNGRYVDSSSLIDLLLHAMSFGKALIGEREFVHLLYEAQVTPDLLINENVKQQLASLYQSKAFRKSIPTQQRYDAEPTIMQTAARNALPSPPDHDMPFIDGPYAQPMKRKRNSEPESADESGDKGLDPPPAKRSAIQTVPVFAPKLTNNAPINWIYPVDSVRGSDTLPSRQTASDESKKKRGSVISQRRNIDLTENDEDNYDDETDIDNNDGQS